MALRLLAENPSKRRGELIVLAYTPIWIAVIGYLMLSRDFARWGDRTHLLFGLALALPLWTLPFLLRAPADRNRPLLELHATRFGVFIAVTTFVQTYFGTVFFFDQLGMEYHFHVTWLLHRTPLFLYFVTIAYFSTYYVVMQAVMRAVQSLLPRAPRPALLVARAAVGYLVAFAETGLMSNDLLRHFFFYRDKSFALFFGSLCYGTLFFITLPEAQRLDERAGDPAPSLRQVAWDALAANLLSLLCYEVFALWIGWRAR